MLLVPTSQQLTKTTPHMYFTTRHPTQHLSFPASPGTHPLLGFKVEITPLFR